MNATRNLPRLSSLLFLLLFPLVSLAHVHLDKSIPAKGERVSPAPESVKLWFSGGVETEWSKIKVTDADGARVDKGEISHIGGEASALEIKLKVLPAGAYKVKWNVVAHDGHRIKGSSTFDVE